MLSMVTRLAPARPGIAAVVTALLLMPVLATAQTPDHLSGRVLDHTGAVPSLPRHDTLSGDSRLRNACGLSCG